MQFHNLTSGQGDARGFVAFIGLDPQPHLSGSSVHKHPGISKMGDSELRRLLYMEALGAISGNNPLRTFYRRLLDRGKAKKLHSLPLLANSWFGLGLFSLANLNGILISTHLGLDKYERIFGSGFNPAFLRVAIALPAR
ncbi:MAG: IS110 family transposase [Caldilineaceae bacterium]